eukprot:g6697.t1
MSVVVALRSKNRAVAEVRHERRPGDDCCFVQSRNSPSTAEADPTPGISFALDQFNHIVRQRLQAIQLRKENEEQRRGWEQMTATDEALLLSVHHNQDQSLLPGFGRSCDDSSSESGEEFAGLLTGVDYENNVKETGYAFGVDGPVRESKPTRNKHEGLNAQEWWQEDEDKVEEFGCPVAASPATPSSAPKRPHGRSDRRHTNPPRLVRCEEDRDNHIPKDGWVEPNMNLNDPSLERLREGASNTGLKGLSVGGGGENLSDASWSSSDDGHDSTVRRGVVKHRGPAFHGLGGRIGTSPCGSDDDGMPPAASSAAAKAEAAGESAKGSGSPRELATTKESPKLDETAVGTTMGEQRRAHRATRAVVGSVGKAVPSPSPTTPRDGASFRRRRIREGENRRGPARQRPSKQENQDANKQESTAKEGSCEPSLNPRAAVETTPSEGPKQRPATDTTGSKHDVKGEKGGGFSPVSNGVPVSCGSPAPQSGGVSFGGGSLAGRRGSVGQRKQGAETSHPGCESVCIRDTWVRQPLVGGGKTIRKSGGDGGGKEARKDHGGPVTAATDGVPSCDDSWVVREFKARVEAARQQDDQA